MASLRCWLAAMPSGVIRLRSSASAASSGYSASAASASATSDSFQVFLGNLPDDIGEEAAIGQLLKNKVPRPRTLIVRKGRDGRTFAIGYFGSESVAATALHATILWSNGLNADQRLACTTYLCLPVYCAPVWPTPNNNLGNNHLEDLGCKTHLRPPL